MQLAGQKAQDFVIYFTGNSEQAFTEFFSG